VARQKLTDGYTDRLGRALREGPRPTSVRGLAEALKGHPQHKHVRGATYGGVRQYAEGSVRSPRVELLKAMAEVLGVRADWLAYDRGPMTEDEAHARSRVGEVSDATAAQTQGSPITPELKNALRFKFDVLRGLGFSTPEEPEMPPEREPAYRMTPEESSELLDSWAKRVNLGHVPHWVAPLAEVQRRYKEPELNPESIGSALRGPLDALGIDISSGLAPEFRVRDWLNDYITAMTPVLLSLAAAPRPERLHNEERRDTPAKE
jgi:hypothetical protein